jgi:hypothetical protein
MDLSGIVLVQPAASADQCGLQDPAIPCLDFPTTETRDVLLGTQDATSAHESRADFLHRPDSDLGQNTNLFPRKFSAPNLMAYRDSRDLYGRHTRP